MGQELLYFCDGCPKGTRVEVEQGDFVCIRTGGTVDDGTGGTQEDERLLYLCRECAIAMLTRLLKRGAPALVDKGDIDHPRLLDWFYTRRKVNVPT